MAVRKFVSKSKRFSLSQEERDRFARLLNARDTVPEVVIDEIEELLRRARGDTARSMDARRSTTPEGRAEIDRIAHLASELSDSITNASKEVQHFLDFEMSFGSTEEIAMIAVRARMARDRHRRREESEKPLPTDGPPQKWVASNLALALAPFWEVHSGRGWSHRGAWGHFVGIAFELANVEAGAEDMARKAAKEFRMRDSTQPR